MPNGHPAPETADASGVIDKLAHWQAIVTAKPLHQPAVRELTKALAEAGHIPDILQLASQYDPTHPELVDAVFNVATRTLPDNKNLWLAYCDHATRHGNVQQENLRWMMMHRRFPADRDVQIGYTKILMRQQRYSIAETIAAEALKQAGADAELHELLANIAERKSDWLVAAEHWKAVETIDPGHPDAAERLDAAEAHARMVTARKLEPQKVELPEGPIEKVPEGRDAAIRELLLNFESLGSNCELGLLQRRFGGEPLGLLRFAGTLPRTALILLKTRFAGIGDPEEMTITATDKEYRVRHMKSGWGMHTRIPPTEENPAEKVLREQCRHTRFLAKKLVKELEQGSKIFVYQRFVLSDREINDIYGAVQLYGPNLVMFVRVADETHPVGSVEWRTERLMICAIDRSGRDREDQGWDISVDYWVYFCRLAKARFAELRADRVAA